MSILFATTTNGVLHDLRMSRHSKVCGMSPSLMSMTRMAMSARSPPLFLWWTNAACPGVSTNKSPGMVSVMLSFLRSSPQTAWRVCVGIMLAPIAWVIPPASRAAMAVPRMASRMLVLPWSTWPMMVMMGWRSM